MAAHIPFPISSPAGEIAQLRIESVHRAKGSERVPHIPVGRDVVASQGCLSNLSRCTHSMYTFYMFHIFILYS